MQEESSLYKGQADTPEMTQAGQIKAHAQTHKQYCLSTVVRPSNHYFS